MGSVTLRSSKSSAEALEALAAKCADARVVLLTGFGLSTAAGYATRGAAFVKLVRSDVGAVLPVRMRSNCRTC